MPNVAIRSTARYVAFLLLATLVIFVVLNGLFVLARSLRHRNPRPAGRDERTSSENVFAPFVHWRHAPHRGARLNVGLDGERRTWQAPGVDEPSHEVSVYGGSTIRGAGVGDDHTVPSYLAKALAKDGLTRVQVRNKGQSAYTNTQESVHFLLDLEEGETPEVVVFYDGVNEVYAAMLGAQPGQPAQVTQLRMAHERFREGPSWPFVAPFFREAPLVRWASRELRGDGGFEPGRGETPEALVGGVATRYVDNLRVLASTARAMGIEALFAWQPCLFSKSVRSSAEEALVEGTAYREFSSALYRLATRRIGDDVEERGLSDRFVDLSAVFSDDPETLYTDYMHLNARGNEIVARALASEVERLLRE